MVNREEFIQTVNYRINAIDSVMKEMHSQDEKWGKNRNLEPILWSAILTEECGEFAQAALHDKFGGDKAGGLREEAVQVAAVALQIIENIDRNQSTNSLSQSDLNGE